MREKVTNKQKKIYINPAIASQLLELLDMFAAGEDDEDDEDEYEDDKEEKEDDEESKKDPSSG